MEKKRSKTSTAVKARYNSKVYDVISIRVPKDMATAFREKCKETKTPQAQVIKDAINAFMMES